MLPVLAAVPDAWVIGWSIVSVVLNVVMSLAIFRLSINQRRYETLEHDVKTSANELVSVRLGMVNQQITQIQTQLTQGDEVFRSLHEADTRLKVEVVERLAGIRELIAESCAKNEDVAALRDAVQDALRRLPQK